MRITNIKESGTNNLLIWALSNSAVVKEDLPLISLINNELFYLVTIEDINFFELFRLTQLYRNKLRIVNEKLANVPTKKELNQLFPGEFQPDIDNPDNKIPLYKAAEHVICQFLNLTSQMNNDNDILHPGAIRLFLPMITRKFDIQIPIAFFDFINSMSMEECNKIFTTDYPNTIREIIDAEVHGVKTMLSLNLFKDTQIIKYDDNYDRYLKLVKYAPLRTYQKSNLYKLALLGFSKKDNISRGEVRYSLFKPNQNTHSNVMKRIGELNTSLELDFVIQLPIQYMQLLGSSFGSENLSISYESSMKSIIETGLIYEDFKTFEYSDDIIEDGESGQITKSEAHNNSIEAYRMRIAEANQTLLNTIPLLINSKYDISITNVFAMMPSLYMTKAVVTVKSDNMDEFITHTDPLLSNMFQEMSYIATAVSEDIRKYK